MHKKTIKKIRNYGLVVVGVGVLIWLLTLVAKPPELGFEVLTFALQGDNHIQPGTSHAPYNSNPPTSGPHYSSPARAGFYEQQIPDEVLIHNMEHGHVVINYNCDLPIKFSQDGFNLINQAKAHGELDEAEPEHHDNDFSAGAEATQPIPIDLNQGQNSLSGFDNQDCQILKDKIASLVSELGSWKIVANPRPANDSLIALAAWRRVAKFDEYNEADIKKFINAFRDRGPEATPN